ncbi:hypothetical protein [Actinophytocola oryzae]|uniref:Uncharacterized protein n=1 Tax=Actinophytocola oryzae TaxID=502181 RepID=A0A4R7UYE4_9PSEU|nr:hypothetical protein [Actinophytocola oryzae]TDV41112.1 hypothetical protein CLV71_121178 [Actinophytocola oryzae]
MVTTRLATVPDEVRAAIVEQVGPVLDMDTVHGGWNSEIATRVRTANETMFVKGLRADHRRVWTQQRDLTLRVAEQRWSAMEATRRCATS